MVDGDHSGGDYNGFAVADYGEELVKVLTGYQAQQYSMVPETPDGMWVGSNTAAAGWVTDLPWADGYGSASSGPPTTTIMEGYFTPWDALDWRGPDVSTRSTLAEGRVIGFQISIPDWDVVGTLHAFHTISGLANTWRMADNFVDGELIGCDRYDCGTSELPLICPGCGPSRAWPEYCGNSAVQSDSWGRIKASLR
jgi:hypothetical protein